MPHKFYAIDAEKLPLVESNPLNFIMPKFRERGTMILPSSQISSIAQRKSGGPIPDVTLSLATHRSLDRNQLELFFFLFFLFA